MRVLVVDDEREIRESLEEFLVDEGYSVSVAADGAEAMVRLRSEAPPQIVILDLLMPVMSGIEVYEAMQSDARLAAIPVIISTSDPSRAPSGNLIMKKPINLDRLQSVIRRFCNDGSVAPSGDLRS